MTALLRLCFTLSGASALALEVLWMRSAGLLFGATAETQDALRNGILEAVVAELPQRAGVLAVDLMVRHLNGESVPRIVDSGFTLVTNETLDDFLAASSA